MKNNQHGNVLFLILLAVALFAALSYAVTQSNRNSGSTTKDWTAKAAALTQNLNAISTALMRWNISGMPYSSMTFFVGPGGDCGTTFRFCNSGATCAFSPTGGKAVLPKFSPEIFKTINTGMAYPNEPATLYKTNVWLDCNADMADWGMRTSLPERGIYLLNVHKDLCLAFNKGLGYQGIFNETPGLNWPDGGMSTACEWKAAYSRYEIFHVLFEQ